MKRDTRGGSHSLSTCKWDQTSEEYDGRKTQTSYVIHFAPLLRKMREETYCGSRPHTGPELRRCSVGYCEYHSAGRHCKIRNTYSCHLIECSWLNLPIWTWEGRQPHWDRWFCYTQTLDSGHSRIDLSGYSTRCLVLSTDHLWFHGPTPSPTSYTERTWHPNGSNRSAAKKEKVHNQSSSLFNFIEQMEKLQRPLLAKCTPTLGQGHQPPSQPPKSKSTRKPLERQFGKPSKSSKTSRTST